MFTRYVVKKNCWLHLFAGLLLLSGCCCYEPSYYGDIACEHDAFFDIDRSRLLYGSQCGGTKDICIPDNDHKLTLCELFDIALRNNPRSAQSWYNAQAAAFNLGMARSVLWPQIDFNEFFILSKGTNFTNGNNNNINNQNPQNGNPTDPSQFSGSTFGTAGTYQRFLISELSVSYLLFDFGGQMAQIMSAKQNLLFENWTHNRVLQDVMNTLLNTYYLYQANRADIAARKSSYEDAEKTLAAAKVQFDAGLNTRADVLLAQSNLAQAKLFLEQSIGDTNVARGNLSNALGLTNICQYEVQDFSADMPQVKLPPLQELIVAAKELRPDFAAAWAAVCQVRANLDKAWSDSMPNITVDADIERTNIFSSTINAAGTSSSITFSLNCPIFHGFFYEYNIRNVYSQLDSAKAQVLITESNLVNEVVTAYSQFATAIEQVKSTKELVDSSQEAFDLNFTGYKTGVKNILDVLKAQSDLASARSQYIAARAKWYTSLIAISYSTGIIGFGGLIDGY